MYREPARHVKIEDSPGPYPSRPRQRPTTRTRKFERFSRNTWKGMLVWTITLPLWVVLSPLFGGYKRYSVAVGIWGLVIPILLLPFGLHPSIYGMLFLIFIFGWPGLTILSLIEDARHPLVKGEHE